MAHPKSPSNVSEGQGVCGLGSPLQDARQQYQLSYKDKKVPMKYEVVDTNYNINDHVGTVGDKTIRLSGYTSRKKYPENLRLVEFYDAEEGEVIIFLTNNFELGPLVIANIYRNRWQIADNHRSLKSSWSIAAYQDRSPRIAGRPSPTQSKSKSKSKCQ